MFEYESTQIMGRILLYLNAYSMTESEDIVAAIDTSTDGGIFAK